MKKSFSLFSLAVLAVSLSMPVQAARGNKICSGKKGGISHCANGKYVCNDGSVSRTTKICASGSSLNTGKFIKKGKKRSKR